MELISASVSIVSFWVEKGEGAEGSHRRVMPRGSQFVINHMQGKTTLSFPGGGNEECGTWSSSNWLLLISTSEQKSNITSSYSEMGLNVTLCLCLSWALSCKDVGAEGILPYEEWGFSL